MGNNLENYLYDTEDVFEDKYTTKHKELKIYLEKLINGLPFFENEEWKEILTSMNANATNAKEAYLVAISKIIRAGAFEHHFVFARNGSQFYFYNSKKWIEINTQFLREFLKAVANKIGIPKYMASSAVFVMKLQKQFIQNVYFETVESNDFRHINIQNGVIAINKYGINLEEHNPRLFLTHLIDLDYNLNETYDVFKSFDAIISSKDLQKTLQQAIAQIFIKDIHYDKQICLYGLEYDLVLSFIKYLNKIVPKDLVTAHFGREDAVIEDLFIDYKEIKKEPKFLETLVIIPCSLDVVTDLTNLDNQLILFHWLIDGVREIIKNQCVYVTQECEEFKSRFNLVSLFVEELNFIKTSKNSKSIVTTFEYTLKQYELYCELHDEEVLGRGNFNKELRALGFESARRGSGNVWFAKFA